MKRFYVIFIALLLPLLARAAGELDGVTLVTSEVSICRGASVNLSEYVENIPPGTSVVWRAASTIVAEEQTPTTTTVYTATFTNGAESAQRTFRVNVVPPPTISAVSPTGAGARICRGSAVTLSASVDNSSEVRWYVKGSPTPIANNSSVTPLQTTSYEINALPTDEACRLAASQITITVDNPSLSINVTGNASRTICAGDALVLNDIIRVSASNSSATLNVSRKEWKNSVGAVVNASSATVFSTPGTYTFTVDIDATASYNSGTACGAITATPVSNLQRKLTVNVQNCAISVAHSTAEVCEGSTVRFTISKNSLVFGWGDVAVSGFNFDSKTLISENASSIVFSLRVLSSTNVQTSIGNIKYSGGGSAPNANFSNAVATKECLPTISSNTGVCPGKNFTVYVNGNSNLIDSVRVALATDLNGVDNGELTAEVQKTKIPATPSTNFNFYLAPADTTIYSVFVFYKIGNSLKIKQLQLQINPNSLTKCQPQFTYLQQDSSCAGIEQSVNLVNNSLNIAHGYTISNVRWTKLCGNNAPNGSANKQQWWFTPALSCEYAAEITFTVGAKTKTVTDTFDVKVRSCPPLLQANPCHDNEPCSFTPNPGSGGANNDTIPMHFCSGQKIKLYVHHYMGINRVLSTGDIAWTPAVQLDTVYQDVRGRDSLSVFWVQPLSSTIYTASIKYEDTITHTPYTTRQAYEIISDECVPPVYTQAAWSGAKGNLCRGNELLFFIPKIYKNNSVTGITPPADVVRINDSVAAPDTFFFRALPTVSEVTLSYQFQIFYNNSLKDTFGFSPQIYISMQACTPEITPPAEACEGSNVNFSLRKNNLTFSADSVTFSGSENTFRPKLSSENASQIGYRIMAHSDTNRLVANVKMQNGETQQIAFSVAGKRCAPYLSAPTNEICPRVNFAVRVNKMSAYSIDSVAWREGNLVKNSAENYTGNLAYSTTFRGNILYSYTDGADTVRAQASSEVPVKIFRQVFTCDDTTICRGNVVNLNSIIKANVSLPTYIETQKAPYFTDTFFIPARVSDCANPAMAVTVEESIVIIVDSAIWVTSMMDTVMCLGDSINLNATGLGSFSWFSTDSSETYATPRPRVAPTHTTDYVVTVKNACGPKFDTAHVTVKTTPTIPEPIYGTRSPLAKNYYTYFVAADPSIDRYEWNYPIDWELIGAGSDSIKFRFSETPGDLSVTAHNVCGLNTFTEKINVRKGYDIVVSPNPVSSMLNLMARSCRMQRIAVYSANMLPMLPVVIFNNPQNEFTINVSDLYPNAYFLFVWVDQQKAPLVYKFVKYDRL
ncbi:MAG: hypothetical protein LBU92_06345 [Prevotellaceae bacterium]|jgi:hypothetical protein|nr:hypothetical protein [Prevotellaceae bacterium]